MRGKQAGSVEVILRSDWTPFVGPDFKRTARIKCSICKDAFVLAAYTIDDSGMVSPNVVCPHCKADNGALRLTGWPFEIDFR